MAMRPWSVEGVYIVMALYSYGQGAVERGQCPYSYCPIYSYGMGPWSVDGVYIVMAYTERIVSGRHLTVGP